MNPASIRRFILTLITGYLAIFGVRQLPYDFENEWLVIVPVLLVVYILTIWIDGQIFSDDETQISIPKKKNLSQNKSDKKGFGDT
ncbi:hypothetical protein N8483_02145 [Synechococcus sp. AH-601-O20]|jgi:hypothetical protein|nr:hypothetical protein [Synechococcus sp. AH-601-O20]